MNTDLKINTLLLNSPVIGSTWSDAAYRQTALIVLGVLFLGGLVNYLLRNKSQYSMLAWASIRSWLLMAPVLFLIMGFGNPAPIIFLTIIAIAGAKSFFQIMGMFNQTKFVMICYAGIVGLGFAAYFDNLTLYNVMPMIVLGLLCLVPLIIRKYEDMIQYISLTLLGFIFLGWSFMHLGLILNFENGLYQMMYLIILTEFCDNTNLAIGSYFPGPKLLPGITIKRSWMSTIVSILITIILAYGMRHLLPDRSEKYWLASGLIASTAGVVGDLLMIVFRKDLGVRTTGPFILGRGDFLRRMDRLIFVAPIYYFVMLAMK